MKGDSLVLCGKDIYRHLGNTNCLLFHGFVDTASVVFLDTVELICRSNQ